MGTLRRYTKPQVVYESFMNTNYIITPKAEFLWQNPLYINDSNNMAASYYQLWRLANGISKDANEVIIIGIQDEGSDASEIAQGLGDSAKQGLDSITTGVPNVGQAMENVGEAYDSVTPLVTLLIVPALGLALIPWLVRKHD